MTAVRAGAPPQPAEVGVASGPALATLATVAEELEARHPGYLRDQPLRLAADAPLAADVTAISAAWHLPLTIATSAAELNPVDLYLRQRLAPCPAPRAAELEPAALRAARAQRAAHRAMLGARAAELAQLENALLAPAIDGLRYTALGHGELPVLVLGALGQPLTSWLPLLARLSLERRVMLWLPRPTDPSGRVLTFAQHCDELSAILGVEQVRRCHVVGWCTGAKLAMRFCRLHPERVASVTWLAGTLKHPGRAAELDTRYERNLEATLGAIARTPELAERLRGVLANSAAGEPPTRLAGAALAQHLLTTAPAPLQAAARHPFRSADTLAVYARQHLELWSHDESAPLPEPRPLLALAGEHDRVVAPASARAALTAFSGASFELYLGATHYLHYERAADVAARLEKWFASAQECAAGSRSSVLRSGHDGRNHG